MISNVNFTNPTTSKSNIYMTKEKWESIVLELPEYQYIDPVMPGTAEFHRP